MNIWLPLKGKLKREVVESHGMIAVRYHDGKTMIKQDMASKAVLYKFNMSSMIKEYKLL